MANAQQKDRRGSSTRQRSQSKPQRMAASEAAATAMKQLAELTRREVESVTGLEHTDDGWTVRLEVVESHRIPDSADILALYEITIDRSGDTTGCRRLRRYGRGQTGDDGP